MEYHVRLTVRAERDLLSIYEAKDADRSTAGARWYLGLEDAISSLGETPHRCPIAPESLPGKKEFRHLLYGTKPHVYRIIFHVKESQKTVGVLTVRHSARKALVGPYLVK